MTRRGFLRCAGASAVALAGAGLASGCPEARTDLRPPSPPLGPPLGPAEERILAHAALAPSSHNTQPWAVRILEKRRWLAGLDATRELPAVDPETRELLLSLGAFVENLAVAASASGLAAEVQLRSAARDSAELLLVRLVAAGPGDERDLERIRLRRTLRKGFQGHRLRPEDLKVITEPYGGSAAWFPAGSREAKWLAGAELDAFRMQTGRDDAQRELSHWIRFSDEDVLRHGDGLTPDTMEAGALAGFYLRHFMSSADVLGKQFREAGIDATATQISEGAGWLVVTAPDEATSTLLDTGRRFERMALGLRERKLAAHPMSQLLEEEAWRRQLTTELSLSGAPQFLLRVGYVAEHPPPVSPRRPPPAFARMG